MPYWQRLFSTGNVDAEGNTNVTAAQEAAIVSILSAGGFFGALSSPFLADHVGRRLGLIISTWIFNLGVILYTLATAIPMFLAGRFFAGFGIGLISAISKSLPNLSIKSYLLTALGLVPLYQSETAPKWSRGLIVGAYQWAITIGLLLAAVVNNSTSDRNDTGSYRIPVAIQLAWSLILFFGLLVLPETPRYLIKKNNVQRAALSLSLLRRLPVEHEAIIAELAEVQATYNIERTIGQGSSYLDCFRPPILKRQLTGMGLQALQQLSGKFNPPSLILRIPIGFRYLA
jgi:MFS transporter, SP family, sugar:H+ symporter